MVLSEMSGRFLLIFGLACLATVSGQPATGETTPPVERNLSALKGVAEPLSAAIGEVDRLAAEANAAETESRKTEIGSRIKAEQERVAQLRGNFLEIVGGAESASYDEVKQAERTLQDQFSDLLDPLVGALREPTEELRRTEQLRKDLAMWRGRFEEAGRVLERIDVLSKQTQEERLQNELARAKRLWESRRSDAIGSIEVLRLRVEEREKSTPSVWESISRMFRNFWATRGLNVVLALAAAVTAWFLSKKGYETIRRASPALRRQGTFIGKLGSILAIAAAGLAALAAVLLVFFLRGDWLLLTLVVVLLLALIWAGKGAVPPYVEQIKMLLNLGTVREGERLLYQGLPWQVTSLGFYSVFTNPALEGGVLRIPLRDVMGMISRPTGGKEPWFPTHRDDWTILLDGTYGKVIRQTPEQVVLLRLGGALRTYQTGDFLTQTPENLMKGFRVSTTFGIDYANQSIATTEVAPVFQKAISDALASEFGRESVRAVKVEFAAAADSSLDYLIFADLTGELAHRMKYIERLMQRVCVDVSNGNRWEIPFTQITVHQAEAPATRSDEN